ncbi:MAG TPA: hypothetical protein DCE41_19760 [Cytophagales bacterium]|nr:hypothetical protein [Cytophagales bacterium]
MDYGGGTTLTRRQWEYVRNPQAVNTLAEEDSTALLWWQRKSEDIWRHNINQISCAISRGATSLPIEVSYYVSDGEATYGLRNLGGVGLFGLELDLDVYALPENGVHTLDLSSLSIARGATTSTLRFSFSSGTTYLEFEAVNEDFATFETIIQNGSDAYFQGLVAAIPSEKSDDAYSSLVTLPDCSLELISTQERIKYLQWLADEWITNGDEEILIVRLLKVGLPASKSEALLDVLRTQPQLLKELYRTTEIRRDQFSNALVEHWQSVRTATNKYQGVEVYFNLTQGLWDKVADKIDYSEDGRSLIFIDASTYQDIYSRGNVQYYVERVQYQEVFSSAPFDPVLVRLPGTDSTLTLPALAVKNFTDAENRQATIQSVMAGIELGLLFMGVGEVTAGKRALQAARAVNSTYKLTRAAVSLALGVGDLTVTAVSGVCDYGGSIDTTQFCSTWNDYKIYLEAGLLTGSVLDVFVSSLKRQGSDLLARGNLEADTERTLRDLVEESADDILAELDAATAALLRNNITNAGQLKRVANKIKSLGEYRDDFLRDLTRRPGNVTTTPPGSNYLADNIGSLDEDILDTWKTLRDANKLPDKRTDFGFLEANKGKTVDELVQQNARARLADQLEPSCPGCAKAIRSSGRLGQRVRTDLIQKIRNGEKPDGLSETWEEVYTKFHSTEELDAFGYSNGTMDWDGFFSANKYQGHHLDPVNLFADENGAFRFMFENIPEDRLEELIEFFNSLENGILVPNKRIVNGVERVIHSNHDLYETQIADFLDRKKAEFSALNSNDELIAEDLFDLLREKNLEFEKKIIQESLLDHSNINSINLRL